MKSGSVLTLEATSSRGTSTHYNFSLNGITAALQRASACQ